MYMSVYMDVLLTISFCLRSVSSGTRWRRQAEWALRLISRRPPVAKILRTWTGAEFSEFVCPLPYVLRTVGRCSTNIHFFGKILTNIGHRFVHQSGLDENSGQTSTFVRQGIVFRVYLMFSQIGKTQNIDKC